MGDENISLLRVIDEIEVPMNSKEIKENRYCFVAFSSKEKQIGVVFDCIKQAVKEDGDFQAFRLDETLHSGESQYEILLKLLKGCAFAIIILDGLRPNVIFEFGILKGLGKPCIVLIENNATTDVVSFFEKEKTKNIVNPKININDDFSDVKDRGYVRYAWNEPQEIRKTIKKELRNILKEIDSEFARMIYPGIEYIDIELSKQLAIISGFLRKSGKDFNKNDKSRFLKLVLDIEKIAEKSNVILIEWYYVQIALKLDEIERTRDALRILESISEKVSVSYDLSVLKAEFLLRLEKFDDSEKAIDDAIKIDADNEPAWHVKAKIQSLKNRLEEAKFSFGKALKCKKDCAELEFDYGIFLYDEKEYDNALKQFNKALAKEKNNPRFLFWKGKVLLILEKKDEARELFQEAIAFQPDFPDAWVEIGRMEKSGKKSLEYFEKALSIKPDLMTALCSKAAVLAQDSQLDEALNMCEKIEKMIQSGNDEECKKCIIFRINYALTLAESRRLKEALSEIEKGLSYDKNDKLALSVRADILSDIRNERKVRK